MKQPKEETAMSNELVVREDEQQALAAFAEKFDWKESAAHIHNMRVPLIVVQSQSQMFEFRDEEDPEKKYKRSFVGIVCDDFMTRSYWPGDGNPVVGTRPSCFSLGGLTPSSLVEEPQSPTCATCPQAQYGSGKGDRQACKLSRNLLLIEPGDEVPLPSVLRLTTTSIRSVDNFLASCVKDRLNYRAAVVKFSLDKGEKPGVPVFSVLKMERIGITPAKLIPVIQQILEQGPAIKARVSGGSTEDLKDVPF